MYGANKKVQAFLISNNVVKKSKFTYRFVSVYQWEWVIVLRFVST